MLSIETTTKLLKLHLQWPDRKRHNGKDDEPIEFFKWLFLNYHDRPEVMEIEDDGQVGEFLEKNQHVLWPSRKEEEKWANLRLEPRIENDVSVEFTIIQSDDIERIGSTFTGRTLDLGLHGMRITVSEDVSPGSIAKLRIYRDDHKENTFTLSAELRWSTALEEGFLVGVKLIEQDDFKSWQANFGKEFVAPAMARHKKAV